DQIGLYLGGEAQYLVGRLADAEDLLQVEAGRQARQVVARDEGVDIGSGLGVGIAFRSVDVALPELRVGLGQDMHQVERAAFVAQGGINGEAEGEAGILGEIGAEEDAFKVAVPLGGISLLPVHGASLSSCLLLKPSKPAFHAGRPSLPAAFALL